VLSWNYCIQVIFVCVFSHLKALYDCTTLHYIGFLYSLSEELFLGKKIGQKTEQLLKVDDGKNCGQEGNSNQIAKSGQVRNRHRIRIIPTTPNTVHQPPSYVE